jgi:hypothetical protein
LDACFLLAEIARIFGLLYNFNGKNYVLIWTKMGVAAFRAIFTQAHLVTLAERPFM